MSFVNTFYRTTLRKTSTFALAILGGAFIFERGFDQGVDWLFGYLNRGVSYIESTENNILKLDLGLFQNHSFHD